jgi:opacity protein-like surface antigen
MLRRILFALVCLIALPSAARAQSGSGTYLSVGGGINKMQRENEDAQLSAPATTENRDKALTSAGPVVSAAFGWRVPRGVRIEIEGQYRSNGITGDTDLSGQNLGSAAERKYGVMANVLYEFNGARIKPYVGGGAGAQVVHEPDSVGSSGGIDVTLTDDTKTSFAYQVIAGAAFPIRRNRPSPPTIAS